MSHTGCRCLCDGAGWRLHSGFTEHQRIEGRRVGYPGYLRDL